MIGVPFRHADWALFIATLPVQSDAFRRFPQRFPTLSPAHSGPNRPKIRPKTRPIRNFLARRQSGRHETP